MNIDEAWKILEATERDIASQAIYDNQEHYDLTRHGILFILEGSDLIGGSEIDLENIRDFVLRRYLLSIPFRSNWVLKSIVSGFHSTGYALLRILFEEVLSLEYYIERLDVAKSAFLDDKYVEPKTSKKLSALGYKDDDFLKIIYKILSEDYVHPKLIRMPVQTLTDNEILPEPYYDPEITRNGLSFTIFLLASSLNRMFLFEPTYELSEEWKAKVKAYLTDATKIQIPL